MLVAGFSIFIKIMINVLSVSAILSHWATIYPMWEICQIPLSCIISMHLLLWISDKRITSYKFRVTSNYFFTSHSLLFIYELLFTIVTSYYLLLELRKTLCVRVTSYDLLHELLVKLIIRVTNYHLLLKLGL